MLANIENPSEHLELKTETAVRSRDGDTGKMRQRRNDWLDEGGQKDPSKPGPIVNALSLKQTGFNNATHCAHNA